MKKLFVLLFLFASFISNAQESFFRGNNNYVVPPPTPFQAPAIVQAGLILNLDAANPDSYPGTGSTWTNLITGNAVANFGLNSNITYNSSNGGLLRFSDGGWAITNSSFGRLANNSIEVWIKIAGTSGPAPTENYTPCIFSEIYNGSINMILAYNGFNFPTSSHQYTAGYYNGGWDTYSTSTNTSDLNNWVHIVATYNGSICTIYKNGIVIGSAAMGNNPESSNAGYFIGHRWDMPDGVYGDYAVVNMYNRALTLQEVNTNFNAVKSRFGI